MKRWRKTAVVAEIGNDWLKVAQVDRSARGPLLSKLVLLKCSEVAGSLSTAFEQAVREQDFARQPVIACLPRQMVNMRILELPSVDSVEIADMVDLQVGKQTPYSKDEITSDYRIIGAGREGYTRVMLAIIRRSAVRERYLLAEGACPEVSRVSVTSEGVLNWYTARVGGKGHDVTAVLDIDAAYADFTVIQNGALLFTRSMLVGADQLFEDYGRWKKKLLQEVVRSVEMFRSEAPGAALDRLLVTGAGVRVDGLDADLGAQLNLPVEMSDPMQGVRNTSGVSIMDEVRYRGVSLTALLGMAAAGGGVVLDLTPDSIRLKKNLVVKSRSLSALAVLLMTALVSFSMVASMKLYFKLNRLAELQEAAARVAPSMQRVENMLAAIKLIRVRRASSMSAIALLSDIQKRSPGGVFFDAVNVDLAAGRVTLGGTAGDLRGIRALIDDVEQSEMYGNVKEAAPSKRDHSGRFRFQLTCDVEAGE